MLQGDLNWFLRGVRMLRVQNDTFRMGGDDIREITALEAAGVTGVAGVRLIGRFTAGNAHFLSVDDDDIVAAVHVRRIGGFVFAAQNVGHFSGESTKVLAFGVDQIPFLIDFGSLENEGLVDVLLFHNFLKLNKEKYSVLRTHKSGTIVMLGNVYSLLKV